MSRSTRSLITIFSLIVATSIILAILKATGTEATPTSTASPKTSGSGLSMSSTVVQEKILKGGDGRVTVALNLTAQALSENTKHAPPAADLVIVMDRSGSMEGQKLGDACQAVEGLIERLGPRDRLALVVYSDGVQTLSPLLPITADNRHRLVSQVRTVVSGGGTNLGGGLQQGLDLMLGTPDDARQRKVILISDGLANQGVTDPATLGSMATLAVENGFSVSTVGVGLDFNETLMTRIADHGAGSYHFLENPRSFARVFESELMDSRQVAVSDFQIRIPLSPGVTLTDAGGYPVHQDNDAAVVYPGDLLSGQHRTLYLTFTVPTDTLGTITMGHLQMQYRFDGNSHRIQAPAPLTVACVADPAAALASINKDVWSDQVVKEEFSQLKEAVAKDIRDGDRAGARQRIREYEVKQATLNQTLGSQKVAENLATDVQSLRGQVEDTFAGPPAAMAAKKKQVAKSLQYEGYKSRRDKH